MMRFKAICLIILLPACSTISRFDQYSYSQAISAKVDALTLMETATQQFSKHQQEVTALNTTMYKIYEYVRNRPQNSISEKMWAMMRDTSGHLYGGFISRWQKEGTLDKTFINEASKLVGDSFDQIAQLESGKIKPAQITN